MLLQSAVQARAYGTQIRLTLANDGLPAALDALNDILCERTPFRLLDLVGAALDAADALEDSRKYIAHAAVWYGCDTLGERVPGPALAAQFQPSLEILSDWRGDPDAWVRRALGVAGHFWAKRSRGLPGGAAQAQALLDFFSPMLEEKDPDAAKGVGWALKTCGRYFPEVTQAWLEEQLLVRGRRPAAIVKRKALKFLPADFKRKVEGGRGS